MLENHNSHNVTLAGLKIKSISKDMAGKSRGPYIGSSTYSAIPHQLYHQNSSSITASLSVRQQFCKTGDGRGQGEVLGAAIKICYWREKHEHDLVKSPPMGRLFSFDPIGYMRETSQEYRIITLG